MIRSELSYVLDVHQLVNLPFAPGRPAIRGSSGMQLSEEPYFTKDQVYHKRGFRERCGSRVLKDN